jgi:hypothetical protein
VILEQHAGTHKDHLRASVATDTHGTAVLAQVRRAIALLSSVEKILWTNFQFAITVKKFKTNVRE